jgi:hypothetical protein
LEKKILDSYLSEANLGGILGDDGCQCGHITKLKKRNNTVPHPVTASKNILSFFLPKNRRSKFNNTATKSLSSSIVIDKLDELE